MGQRPIGATTAKLWQAVGGPVEALSRLSVHSEGSWLGGTLAVDELALASVAAALLAASELARARGVVPPEIDLSGEHVALSFHSERHVLLDGSPTAWGFAPLSRLVRCAAGGWARTHGNYPHHASALLRALRIGLDAADPGAASALENAARTVDAVALEDAVHAAGGCAAALRSVETWRSAPPGRAAGEDELVAREATLATHAARELPALEASSAPASGVRVLDLTRVIAGPVAGRTLAALGAEVLRADPPGMPEIEAQHIDSDPGKRSAVLDLADSGRRETLLAGADVLLMGYRPGALARFGMAPHELAERHPHLVQVSLSAWGSRGPWAQRRGFDSLVQLATGIADECRRGADSRPGALPAQALDHATGHLMAAGALLELARRAQAKPHRPARLSLARTAMELLDAPRPADACVAGITGCADADEYRVQLGRVSLISPPGRLDGVPLRWPQGPRPFGRDAPEWSSRRGPPAQAGVNERAREES